MARYRRSRRRAARVIRAAPRAYYRSKRRSHRRSSGGGFGIKSLLGNAMSGAVYGAVRQPLDNYVGSKLKPMLGFAGNYVDEAAAIITLVAAKKLIKNSTVSKIADMGLAIEGARIGAKITSGMGLGAASGTLQTAKVYS